jgi:nucleoid-associated protein YgaU
MNKLEKAQIEVIKGSKARLPPITVLFNPAEYTRERSNTYKSTAIAGLASPLIHFVNGEADQLTMELFLDDYTDPDQPEARGDKKPVHERVKEIAGLLEIDPELHAPSPVVFHWGTLHFEAIIEKVSQKFTLFNPDGIPARASVNVTFKEYLTLPRQLRNPTRDSSDRSKRRVLDAADNMWLLASREYGDPALWRKIAYANDIDNPWEVGAGTWLVLLPLEPDDGPRRSL